MPNHAPENALPLLDRYIQLNAGELLRLLLNARSQVRATVSRAARDPQFARSGATRNKVYKEIGTAYDQLTKALGEWINDVVHQGVYTTAHAVNFDLKAPGEEGRTTKFSRTYAMELLQVLSPGNGEALVAVQTGRMKLADISFLRTQVINVMREATLTGATSREVQKEIQARMLDAVDGLPGWQFIDKSGRAWKPGNYFNMLTRTVTSRVVRETYVERLAGEGHDLVTLEGGGTPCPICARWRGFVCSATGATPGFPTLDEAQRAGVFHPNCVCEPRYVANDDPRVEAQRGKPPPAGANTKELNEWATNHRKGKVENTPQQPDGVPVAVGTTMEGELARFRELNTALKRWVKAGRGAT